MIKEILYIYIIFSYISKSSDLALEGWVDLALKCSWVDLALNCSWVDIGLLQERLSGVCDEL